MMLQYPSVADYVGNTSLVRLQRLAEEITNTLLLKLEANNPVGSVKDRAVLSMISRAETRDQIQAGDTLIEATSGNTRIALAMAAAIKGYMSVYSRWKVQPFQVFVGVRTNICLRSIRPKGLIGSSIWVGAKPRA